MKLALFAAVVLHLYHTEPGSLPELATVTRSVADIRDLSVNSSERSVTFNGSSQQNAIAEWVVPHLDITGPHPIGTPFRVGQDDMVNVFYLQNAAAPEQLMEIATAARSLAEVPRAFTYAPTKAIVARGSADQIALMEWLLPNLDLTAPQSGSPEHRVGGNVEDIARVFYLNHMQTVQDLQELSTTVRTIGDIRRVFTYSTSKALAVRATAEQIAVSEFLIGQLNRPVGSFAAESNDYQMIGKPDGVVRLFVLKAATLQDLQRRANEIRAATGIRRGLTYGPHRVLILRGTPAQIAEAERLVNTRE